MTQVLRNTATLSQSFSPCFTSSIQCIACGVANSFDVPCLLCRWIQAGHWMLRKNGTQLISPNQLMNRSSSLFSQTYDFSQTQMFWKYNK